MISQPFYKRSIPNKLFLLTIILVGFSISCQSIAKTEARPDSRQEKLPLVYSAGYDISILLIEYLHPFDTHKYSRVYRHLLKSGKVSPSQFYAPDEISDTMLLSVHTPEYLASLKKSRVVARIAEIGLLAWIPNGILQNGILKPMRRACQGTIMAGELALQHGWAINLSGGYHHAKPADGEGFCFFADIPIMLKYLSSRNLIRKALVVDLDAHQGNGVEICSQQISAIVVFDLYNEEVYPQDEAAKRMIKYNYPVLMDTEDKAYIALLKEKLSRVVEAESPDLIVYNAGTDIYEKDPLGGLQITREGIIERDQYVFQTARQYGVPIVMVLSGGYTGESAEIIGTSILEILAKQEQASLRDASRGLVTREKIIKGE